MDETTTGIRSPDPAVRRRTAQTLANDDALARAHAVELVEACADTDDDMRQWVTAALEAMGPPTVDSCRRLAALVSADHPDVGFWAATLLGRLGASAASAVPELTSAIEAAPPNVRQKACWALGCIGAAAAPALAALDRAASSGDPRLARLARSAADAIRNAGGAE